MGSINCKEYVTTTAQSDSCAKQSGCGTMGSYHTTSDATVSEYTDAVEVCNVADIGENEMKQLDFQEDTKILLINQNGKLSAIGNKCSHYGAPLATGCLGEGRVRCPWHGACFSIETGDIEDFPGLDSIPVYKVEQHDGKVMVRAKRKDLANSRRIKDMAQRDESNETTFVVVGGGPSGGVCVETLRQEGFTGRIFMICRESNLPYDRVKISKAMNIAIETIQFRTAAFYEEHGIEVLLGVEATHLDTKNKTLYCSDETVIKYDKIYIATGSSAHKLPIEGASLKNVFTVRNIDDVNAIQQLVDPELNVVCLGSSFIALETSSYLANKVKSVSVVGRDDVPLKKSFGPQIGERVLKLFEENGVKMIMDSGITEIVGDSDGAVTSVTLKDGSELPCDVLIMGTGTRFNTDFMRNSDILFNADGSIDTDMQLRTNVPDVFVGGDIAKAPVFAVGNERAAIGHYQLAQYHGRIAAKNMAGQPQELRTVPFFFTMLFGKGFRYSGYGPYSDVVIDGSLEDLKFAAYFVNENDLVVAMASCARDPIVSQFAELQSQGLRLYRSDLKNLDDPSASWTSKLNNA